VLKNGAWRNATYYLVLIGALYLSGCSSQAPQKSEPLGVDKSSRVSEILFNALGLVGTPYRYGGSSPANGFDCSGLIQYVYRESANLALPRTVAEMNSHAAPDIAEDNLQSGDLVIFATDGTSRPSHAGIYVGEGRFVHAPSRGGEVRMDFLDDKYWQRSYLNAKRPLACC
jgi:cell wall-associated NlpC family hydrolase